MGDKLKEKYIGTLPLSEEMDGYPAINHNEPLHGFQVYVETESGVRFL